MKQLKALAVVALALASPACGVDGYSKEDEARVKISHLDSALDSYWSRNKLFPASLEALARPQPNGGEALVKEHELLDAWGHPFEYDHDGPRNDAVKPDVWCKSPKGKIIGNWGGGPGK